MAPLQEAAKAFVTSLALSQHNRQLQALHQEQAEQPMTSSSGDASAINSVSATSSTVSLQMKKFPNLFNKVSQFQSSSAVNVRAQGCTVTADIQGELNHHWEDMKNVCVDDGLRYWKERRVVYLLLALIAEDLLAAPANEAYVERIFSLTGYLTSGRRNRMTKSLHMRAFLKLNRSLFR